jgi:hypothetical protein
MLNGCAFALIIATVAFLASLGSAATAIRPIDEGEVPVASSLDAPLPFAADRARTGHTSLETVSVNHLEFEVAGVPAMGRLNCFTIPVVSRVRAVLNVAAPSLYSSAICLKV